ncbi:hypothetical protein CPB85DRAFT_707184 [Mucidula mucida]|nr:hypothetical protein CPB85DRAFT_707184 [Mucidula mucida]
MSNASELTGLLDARKGYRDENSKAHRTVWSALTATVLVALLVLLVFKDSLPEVLIPWVGGLPKDPSLAALHIMKKAPVIDGHIDLPILVRELYANNISAFDLASPMPAHVDIPRLREGRVGGFFWSVYVGCPNPEEEGERVRLVHERRRIL